MRQIAGFGTGEDTNQRFKYLIAQGQTGLSIDFDMPTLMGYDSDHPMSEGEVGREGVADRHARRHGGAVRRHRPREDLRLDDDQPVGVDPARHVRRARREARATTCNKLSGTIQADILKEYMAQKEWIFPIAPSVRIVRDCITYCAENMKRYNPINISGYHISEAGASPLHEAAFTLRQPHRLRRGGAEDRHGRRRVRPAAGLLLRLPGATSSRRSPSSGRCGAATRRS